MVPAVPLAGLILLITGPETSLTFVFLQEENKRRMNTLKKNKPADTVDIFK